MSLLLACWPAPELGAAGPLAGCSAVGVVGAATPAAGSVTGVCAAPPAAAEVDWAGAPYGAPAWAVGRPLISAWSCASSGEGVAGWGEAGELNWTLVGKDPVAPKVGMTALRGMHARHMAITRDVIRDMEQGQPVGAGRGTGTAWDRDSLCRTTWRLSGLVNA